MRDRVFLDTNVILDLLGERVPFYDAIAKIVTLVDQGKISLFVSALSYSTVHYILSKYESPETARGKISKFKVLARTVDLTDKIIDKGLVSQFSDFEDALQYHAALKQDCNIILTRNGKDYKLSEIPVMTPDEYLNSLGFK